MSYGFKSLLDMFFHEENNMLYYVSNSLFGLRWRQEEKIIKKFFYEIDLEIIPRGCAMDLWEKSLYQQLVIKTCMFSEWHGYKASSIGITRQNHYLIFSFLFTCCTLKNLLRQTWAPIKFCVTGGKKVNSIKN